MLPDFLFLFSFPCAVDHEQHWPPCMKRIRLQIAYRSVDHCHNRMLGWVPIFTLLWDTTEERGIAATTTCHRSSRAKVRPDHPVPILGRPCQRRWRTHARDQPPEQSSVGMHQEVLPGALRPAESTVETRGSTVESGGDGGPTIRVHDVGPPPRTLPVTEEDTPPTTPASYRVPPRARHLPTAFVRSGPQEDRAPKGGSYHSTTATSVRGSHGQTTRRAPPVAADGRKTRRRVRSWQGTPRAELDGLSQGRLPSVRSHRRLYGGQPAHIRS